MTHPDFLIDVQDVTVRRDLTTILENLSWRVKPGENWVMFGPNGAGKTSLLNVIQGYLWPTSGTVQTFAGTLGDGVDVREMRRLMPVVSESVRQMIHGYLSGTAPSLTSMRPLALLSLYQFARQKVVQDKGLERGTDAMPGDVNKEKDQLAVGKRHDIEDVPADMAGRSEEPADVERSVPTRPRQKSSLARGCSR